MTAKDSSSLEEKEDGWFSFHYNELEDDNESFDESLLRYIQGYTCKLTAFFRTDYNLNFCKNRIWYVLIIFK